MKSTDNWIALLDRAVETTPKPVGEFRQDFATLRALVRAWAGAKNPRERAVRAEQIVAFTDALTRVEEKIEGKIKTDPGEPQRYRCLGEKPCLACERLGYHIRSWDDIVPEAR